MADADPVPLRRLGLRGAARGALAVTVVVLVFAWLLPRLAEYDDVMESLGTLSMWDGMVLALAAVFNLVTYWLVLMAALPGLTFFQAGVVNQSSTAIANIVPGGGALGVGVTYAMFSSWGFDRSSIARAVLVSGVWNTLIKFGFPVVALAILVVQGEASVSLVATAGVGVTLLVSTVAALGFSLQSDRLARIIGSWIGRAATRVRGWVGLGPIVGMAEVASGFRRDSIVLLRRRWASLTAASLLSHGALYLVLLVALRLVGVPDAEVGWAKVLAAFAFVRLVSALPITPGGLGVVELGLAAALGAGLVVGERAPIVAGVLVFRFVAFLLPVASGAVSFAIWRNRKSWKGVASVESS